MVAVEGEHRLCHARIRDVECVPALQHVDVRAERIAEFEERKRLQLRFARGRKAVDHLLAREALADLRGKALRRAVRAAQVAQRRAPLVAHDADRLSAAVADAVRDKAREHCARQT